MKNQSLPSRAGSHCDPRYRQLGKGYFHEVEPEANHLGDVFSSVENLPRGIAFVHVMHKGRQDVVLRKGQNMVGGGGRYRVHVFRDEFRCSNSPGGNE
jgi:hypothetical protein